MRRLAAILVLLAVAVCVLLPTTSFTEDQATVRLARTIYALGKEESYETKLALGTVVMNRVDSVWFPNTLAGVLSEQQQFPCGSRYDDESLRAAHALLTGTRTLDADVLYYAQKGSASRPADDTPLASAGAYAFYDTGTSIL